MVSESLYFDGAEILAIRHAAAQAKMVVSLGFSEKVRYSSATLFNSNLVIGSEGEVLVHHRKLVPTFFEKLTWSSGDGFGLRVAETGVGRLGALVCGENTNPLARYALMAQGEQVHISTWPAIWPTRLVQGDGAPSASTKDRASSASKTGSVHGSEAKVPAKKASYDNVAANRTRAAAHCFEAKCFGILCSGYLSDSNISDLISESGNLDSAAIETVKNSSRGASMFLDPTGAVHPAFTVDPVSGKKEEKDMLQAEEGILYADLDLNDCVEGKQYHDVVGGYQRLDVFDLKVDRRRREPATFVNANAVEDRGVEG